MKNNKDSLERLHDAKHDVVDYQTDDPEADQPPTRRTMKQWRSFVEERIQNAIDDGHFDNLEGQGKPFQDDKNPFGDKSNELSNGILKNNGYSPEWIERDLVIRRELDAAREAITASWHYYQPDPEAQLGWQAAVRRFDSLLAEINQKIDDFNLVVPILSKQRLRLRLDEELAKITNTES